MPNHSIAENKRILRKKIRSNRVENAPEKSQLLSAALYDHLSSRPDFQTIALYSAMQGEPDITTLLALLPYRTFVFPRICEEEMHFYVVNSLHDDLEKGRWDILEPKSTCAMIDSKKIDLFLCPGMGFTKSGQRLGKGRGYYDRYFHHHSHQAPCYGVTFSEMIFAELPHDQHDVTMQMVFDA